MFEVTGESWFIKNLRKKGDTGRFFYLYFVWSVSLIR